MKFVKRNDTGQHYCPDGAKKRDGNDSGEEDGLPALIEALQHAGAYPHPVEAVHVIQTHASCVFLTGEYAYKIKKPVDFGFLDYRTLEQRRLCCEQELLLNLRLCPDFYLDVLPITEQDGQIQIGGSGQVVEWAVHMRQLREAEMLPARLKARTLTRGDIERLAHLLATFHTRAHTDDTIAVYGAPESVSQTIAVTLRTMQQVTANTPWEATYQTLCAYFAHFQEVQKPLLEARCAEKRIRDCHGDLRLQNICLDTRFSGGIQIFDCIEFNAAFRYIDTAADIAYLVMDLDLMGHAALRARLMEVYAQEANDSGLTAILPFYLTYRAMVRGNIALLAAAESEIPEAERQEQRDLADAAYDLARAYAGRRSRLALLITVGFSGCGKSVLAQEVSRRLPAIHLSSDRFRKEQAGTAVTTPLEAPAYTPAQRSAIYDALFQQAGAFLAQKETVLLDATFLDSEQRQAAAALARKHGAEFWILHCQCPDAVIRQRLAARTQDPNASDAGLSVYQQQRLAYPNLAYLIDPPAEQENVSSGDRLLLDMTQPVHDLAHVIVSRLLAV